MNNLQRSMSLDQNPAHYIKQEAEEIVSIYTRLYPSRARHFIFREGKTPICEETSVIEEKVNFHPGQFGADYLGQMTVPGPSTDSLSVTIAATIPRPPLPSEYRQTTAPWVPQRPLAPLFKLYPMLYEHIRYLAEMRRKKMAGSRHRMTALPFGKGAGLFPVPAAPASDKKPSVLIGMHWLEVGGAEKLAFDTIRWAHEAGLRVFVVASVPELQRLQEKLPDSPDVIFLRLDRYLPHHLWPRYVEELIRAENIRLIHIHHCQPLYDSLPQVRVATPWVKVIDSTHIVEHSDGGYPRVSGVWSNFIDIHHVISGELIDYYRDVFHVMGKVRLGRMLDRDKDMQATPEFNMQAAQRSLHVGFIGRLYYQKRPVVVMEAFRRLARWAAQNKIELTASIVGEGPFLSTLHGLARRYGLQDQITFLPANTDVPALLEEMDILLLPSNNEGLALVCYEAIGHGCIPVSTNVGSQYEIVPPELLVPLSPRATVCQTLNVVDRLWRDPAFLAKQKQELVKAWSKISSDMTAREVLMPIYQEAALVEE